MGQICRFNFWRSGVPKVYAGHRDTAQLYKLGPGIGWGKAGSLKAVEVFAYFPIMYAFSVLGPLLLFVQEIIIKNMFPDGFDYKRIPDHFLQGFR